MRSWFIHGLSGLGVTLLLAACGFHPMMGAASNQAAVSDQLAKVEIGEIKDRAGQMLRNRLIDGLYHDQRPVAPEYRLEVRLLSGQEPLAVAKDASVSRGQWSITADYHLIHIKTGRWVFAANSRTLPGYNNSLAQYSSFVSEQSAYDRGIVYLGDDIVGRLAMFFARDPDQRPDVGPSKP